MADEASTGAAGASAHQSGGFWYTWWRGDALPDLAAPTDLAVSRLADPAEIARATGLAASATLGWRADGHRCYVVRLGAETAGYGWSATSHAAIGELGLAFALEPGNRYLWGFVTLLAWRGQGVYPSLLQAILRQEGAEAARFWIGHAPDNDASAHGILRAGFQRVGELWLLGGGGMVLHAAAPGERAEAGAAVLGVPLAP